MKAHFFFFIFLALICINASYAQFVGYNQMIPKQSMYIYPNIIMVNPDIKALMKEVSIQNLEDNIRYLQNLGPRNGRNQATLQAQNWLVEQLENCGLNTYVNNYPDITLTDTLDAGNVIAVQTGTEYPDEYIVISSHYDVGAEHPGIDSETPGADDNASGTSGVLEIARVLSQYKFKRSIIYVSFNFEEYGLVGSSHFVQKCYNEGMNILGCFNIDMLGYMPVGKPLQLYYNAYRILSYAFSEYFRNTASLYLPDIPISPFSREGGFMGDDKNFSQSGYPAIYIGDVENLTPCYHRPCDTIGIGIDSAGVNNMELVQAFVQATITSVAELANAQYLQAITDNEKILINWDKAAGAAKYVLYKNGNPVTETTATTYVDNDVAHGTEYVYYVGNIKAGENEEYSISNSDTVVPSMPVILPYFNNFENSMSDFRVNDASWALSQDEAYSGTYSLSNSPTDNAEAIAELRWFSIPDTAKNVTLSVFLKSINQSSPHRYNLPFTCIEVTKDRKTWKRLYNFASKCDWAKYEFSLNEYIGESFVQLRFKSRSYDENTKAMFDDIGIDFDAMQLPLPKPKNVKITDYGNPYGAPHIKRYIEWDITGYYASLLGYNIYRDGYKINDEILHFASYNATKDSNLTACYQVTAVYSEQESDFSEEVCAAGSGYVIEEYMPFANIHISPNPSSGIFNITTGLAMPYTITIYGLNGIKVYQQLDYTDGQINLSYLPKGTYFIKISTNKESISKRVVIE